MSPIVLLFVRDPRAACLRQWPQFTSDEFKRFTVTNGIKHTLVPSYHPSSNGAAERSVQILKRRLEKVCDGVHGSLNQRLANVLLLYRSTPHTTTGRSPAELFLKRQPRTRFSFLKPLLAQTVEDKQEIQRQQHDKTASREARIFHGGDRVGVRSFRGGREKWLWGNITKVCGPRTYVVNVAGARRYVHVDHIIRRNATDTVESAVIPKPVIVRPVLDNEQAQSERDVSTTMAQSEQPSLTNEVERHNVAIPSNMGMPSGVREVDSPVAEYNTSPPVAGIMSTR